MRRVIFLAAMSALVLAKPEMYREKEDFQFSRSSSDDGTKSGFYGAQRGNMGGNYEKAHNMDMLAQHQMSGLVKQVDGELGEGANTRTGSVYTAANSRGIYGSGNYDLSNLKGRNFAEGESYGTSQSHSSLASQNSGYRGQAYSGMGSGGYSSRNTQSSRYSGYQASNQAADHLQADHLQTIGQGFAGYDSDSQAGHNTRYHSQYGAQGPSEFDQSTTNLHSSSDYGSSAQSRYVAPNIKFILRPGVRVAAPITAQTYDLSQSALSEDKTALNRDAEVLDHEINYKPTNKVKHYESSYSYRKEWEKHNTQPAEASVVVVPSTVSPFPKNSELYEDAQLLQGSNSNMHLAQSSDLHSAYSANTASSSHSRLQSGFNSQQNIGSDYHANMYGHSAQNTADAQANLYGAHNSALRTDLNNVESLNLKPKSYQSSYSYHKSWERKGDPYVIVPAGGVSSDLTSQKLTAASANRAALSSHQYGSHSSKSHQSYAADCDCDEEGHVRVARSYNTDQELEDQQKYQNRWENLGDLDQQTQSKFENLEDLGQQSQSEFDNLEYLGQQTQNKWDNLHELGQQTQGQWDNLQQLGQQTQNEWDNLQQLGQQSQNQLDKIEDLGQQAQRGLEQQTQNENFKDVNQQLQNSKVEVPFFEQQANGEDVIELPKSHTLQESHPNPNIWDQQQDFEQQINTQTDHDVSHNVPSIEKQQGNKETYDPFTQNVPILYGSWSQTQNTNSEISEHISHTLNGQAMNTFPSFLSNTEGNRHWNINQNQGQGGVNPTLNIGYQFWHKNEYNKNNKFEYYNSNTNHNTASNTNLQSLWDKIDNIAGEFPIANGETEDTNVFKNENSNYDFFNQNWHQMENDDNWSIKPNQQGIDFFKPQYHPESSTSESHQINTETIAQENNYGHHNLFNDYRPIQSTSTSTTVKPNPVIPMDQEVKPTPQLETDSHLLSNPEDKQYYPQDHSADVGRGDIGPEDTVYEIPTANKPYKTKEQIESLSLTKDESIKKEDTFSLQSQIQSDNSQSVTDTTLTVLSLTDQEKHTSNHQHKLFTTLHAANSATTTTPLSITTTKNNSNDTNYTHIETDRTIEVINEPKPVLDLQSNYPLEHTTERVGTIDETQQQNLDQFQDVEQQENIGQQLQNSWFDKENLQEGYDQQNMDQQFEGFEQHENIEDQTPLQDFGQDKPEVWKPQDLQQGYDQQNMDQQFEVFHPHENLEVHTPILDFVQHKHDIQKPQDLKQEHEQQNMDKQFEVFQPHENLENQTPLQDFGKDKPEVWNPQDLPQGYDQENMDQQFEVFQQHENLEEQTSIQDFVQHKQDVQKPQDLHDQQNMNSQFEVFQPHENVQKQTLLQDFGQHKQDVQKPTELEHDQQNIHENVQDQSQDFGQQQQNWKHVQLTPSLLGSQNKQNSEAQRDLNTFPQEIPIVVKSETDLQSSKTLKSNSDLKSDTVSTPVEVKPEKPGFWKSVGTKFLNAKDKVKSWFKSS